MNEKTIEEFYCLPACKEHRDVDELFSNAIDCANHGMPNECMYVLEKASQIITDKLEESKQCNCSGCDKKCHSSDLVGESMGKGGLFL